jgi:hypothetical protein
MDLDREVCVAKACGHGNGFAASDMVASGTVDVVLFNPHNMQYDGALISGVPITPCITTLGLAAPLAR